MKNLTLSLLISSIITTASYAEDICDGAYQAQNYNQATNCYVKQLKKERTFNNLFRAGASYHNLGRYKEALPYLKEAEKKAITPDDYALIYNWLSVNYSSLGNSEQDLAYSMKVLDLRLKSGNREEIGTSYSNLGSYYFNQGQPKKALEYYEKALEYKEESERSTTYGNMAVTYGELNNPQKEEEMYHASIEISEKTGNYHALAQTKVNLGAFYYSKDRYGEARSTLEEALVMCQKTKQIDDESHTLSILAKIDHREGKSSQAREKASEALRLAKLSGNTTILDEAQDAWNLVNGK